MVLTRQSKRIQEELDWEELHNQIDIDFPNAYFDICLGLNNIEEYNKKMDEKFTDEKTIIVKDDRANTSSYHWSEWPENELAEFINYTCVTAVDDKPITLRQVFKTMEADPHYERGGVCCQDHRFIEFIKWDTPIQISFCWGS
tara:strand:+ start:190 stop:618 length:429 start_codon:yes stop_codon:yes gene_type:complete